MYVTLGIDHWIIFGIDDWELLTRPLQKCDVFRHLCVK